MAKHKRNGFTAQKWHESLVNMRRAYAELVAVCTMHNPSSTQYRIASNIIDGLNDLAKLHGRPDHSYFSSAPHSTHAVHQTAASR